jgi:hypothetical protein
MPSLLMVLSLYLLTCGCGDDHENSQSPTLTSPGRTWTTVSMLAADTGNATEPQAAVDEKGNAFVVWSQFDWTR